MLTGTQYGDLPWVMWISSCLPLGLFFKRHLTKRCMLPSPPPCEMTPLSCPSLTRSTPNNIYCTAQNANSRFAQLFSRPVWIPSPHVQLSTEWTTWNSKAGREMRIFSHVLKVQTGFVALPTSHTNGYRRSSQGGKAARSWICYSTRSTVQDMNWYGITLLPLHVVKVWAGQIFFASKNSHQKHLHKYFHALCVALPKTCLTVHSNYTHTHAHAYARRERESSQAYLGLFRWPAGPNFDIEKTLIWQGIRRNMTSAANTS